MLAIMTAVAGVGSWMLVCGLYFMAYSVTQIDWDNARGSFAKWLHSPNFLKGLGFFLSSLLLFGLSFLLIPFLLA